MKKLLLLLALVPTLAFSQISSWRTNPPQRQETPRIQPQTPQRGVSEWRTQTEPIRPGQPVPKQPLVRRYRPTIGNPYGLYYGAWGWYQPYPYYWYDSYGYRNRGVVHIYENGRRDTVKRTNTLFGVGFHKTNNEQIGGYFLVGNNGYFIADFVSTYKADHSTYFPHGNITQVDFPLTKDLIKERTIYLGAGKRFKKSGVHAMLGFGSENIYYRGRDAIGEITFPKSHSTFTSIKFGVFHNFKNFTLKFDTDQIRGYNQLGLGLHF